MLIEGETEKVFLPKLREFLAPKLSGKMPRLSPYKYDGRIPTGGKLKRDVEFLLTRAPSPADHVVALTDVYTGGGDFVDAADAKAKMRSWVGPNPYFHPHVALHDFEAWILPYWARIRQLAKSNRSVPAGSPESVNHSHPPSWHLKEAFRTGAGPRDYVKTRDALSILQGQDLKVSAEACPELKALVNTILDLSGGELL